MSKYNIIFLLLFSNSVFGKSSHECGANYENRIKDVSKINSLKDVRDVWRKHKKCLDGETAESFSIAIGQLLDKNWDQIVGSKLLKEKVTFEALSFGISEVWEYQMSQRILKNAKEKCTHPAKRLCEKIVSSDPTLKSNLMSNEEKK